jgi:hypothetical protein
MILDDIIALLREVSRNAHVVDNERIDDRIWESFIMLKRNLYIKNYINEKGTLEQNNLQFEILETEIYDSALTLGGISIGEKILRTEVCPTLVEGRSGVAVYELTNPDMLSKTIACVPMDRLRWCGNGKTNKDTVFAAFYDGRFYIKSRSNKERPLTHLRVVGIFADPTQVSTYNRLTDDYPLNDYQVEYMKNAILQQDFAFIEKSKADVINDASGNLEPIQRNG